ncbi:MAG TPA: type VI secretion system protein TssL, long form [Acidisphaera sp.]|nr:type VI secretion system protein TssL, long form [Acidisphaera sp.]
MSDDPFAEPSDPDRTMIRPRPGGTRAAAAEPPPRPVQLGPGPDLTSVPTIGTNPLVAIAAPLLAAAIRIASTGRGGNPDADLLRRGLVAEVRRFEQNALATGMDTRPLRAARYALCATIDDLVLSTPWGAASTWAQQSLTSIFHTEVIGGDRFFDILEQMQKDLGRNGEVVELMYLCTSLGFEGRYRVMPRGVAALNELRDSVYRVIRNRRGDFERELSPHWRGLDMSHRPLLQRVPLWAIALGTVTLALLIYLGFNFALSDSSDVAYAELYGLPPRGAPTMVHVPVDSSPAAVAAAHNPPPPPAAPVAPSRFAARIHKFLEPEIKAGLVVVLEDAQSVTVRLTNRNMFGSGQATLNSSYLPLVGRIGEAIQDEPGHVVVNGYTDNQPIHTPRFPSNFELSKARADVVADLIKAKLTDKSRVTSVGKADAEPLEPNTTPEGRQANRRTEIVLTKETNSP